MFNIDNAFARMTTVVEAATDLLKAYRDDFFVLDRQELERNAVPGSRFVWAIREHGTHLAAIGLHRKNTEFLAAALDAHPDCCVYEVLILEDGDATIRHISYDQARALFLLEDFSVVGNTIIRAGVKIASFVIAKEYHQGNWKGSVTFTMERNTAMTHIEKPLKTIALNLFLEQIKSLFGYLENVTFEHPERDIRAA